MADQVALPDRAGNRRVGDVSGHVLLVAIAVGDGFGLGRRRGREFPNQGAAGDFDDQVFAGKAVHAFAATLVAIVGDQAGFVELADEIVQVVVGLEDHAAAATTVAAARPALGTVGFAREGDRAFSTVPGAGVNFDFVNKHAGGRPEALLARKGSAEIKTARPETSPWRKRNRPESGGGQLRRRRDIDAAAFAIEQDAPGDQGEQRPVAADAHVLARRPLGAALADDDAARADDLAAISLDAKTLADAVAAVTATALTFL